VLEQRGGVKVVRALTSDDGAFKRITTRRIVDFTKAGVRGVSAPFIGKLNNQRVRAALQGAIGGFLTSMLVDEALVGFNLAVTATRDDEIAGRAMVNIILQPVFELEFIPITLTLE
jgi:phage tail sheath protein FI